MRRMESAEPYKQFIREITLRIERSLASFERRAEADRKAYLAHFQALQDDMRDLREDSRAQTRALLKVLDRLDNGGGAATT
jgi:hypothetical protein